MRSIRDESMRWALVGASTVAPQHMIRAIRAQAGGGVAPVVSGSRDRAEAYAREHGIPAFGKDVASTVLDWLEDSQAPIGEHRTPVELIVRDFSDGGLHA